MTSKNQGITPSFIVIPYHYNEHLFFRQAKEKPARKNASEFDCLYRFRCSTTPPDIDQAVHILEDYLEFLH